MREAAIQSWDDARKVSAFLKSPKGNDLREKDLESWNLIKGSLVGWRLHNDQKFRINHYAIKNKLTLELSQLKFNTGQEKLWGALKTQEKAGLPVRILVIKCRQWGGSTETAAYMFDNAIFGERAENSSYLILSNELENADHLFSMHEIIYDNPPEGLVFPSRMKTAARHWKFSGVNSQIQVATAASGVKAKGKGRGHTRTGVHVSELAYYGAAEATMLGVVNSVPRQKYTYIILETTANGALGYAHDLYKLCVEGKSEYMLVFVGWHECEDMGYTIPFACSDEKTDFINSATKKENDLQRLFKLKWEQLKWRRLTIATECANDERLFTQEYPITAAEAFLTSGHPRFNVFILDRWSKEREIINRHLQPAKYTITNEAELIKDTNGDFAVYEEPEKYKYKMEPREYIVSVDVAEGKIISPDGRSRDESCIQVLKRGNMAVDDPAKYKTLTQVAKYTGYCEPIELAVKINHLGRWYNNALAAIESNGSGGTVNFALQHIHKYPHVYCRNVTDYTSLKVTKQLGFYTSRVTKPQAIDYLAAMIEQGEIEIVDDKTLSQCLTFVKKDVKIEAQSGCKDDEVMALAIGAFVNMEYRNFKEPKDSMKKEDEFTRKMKEIETSLGWRSGKKKREEEKYDKEEDRQYVPAFG
jgi:hypothetical protein